MGGSSWSDDFYTAKAATRAATGADTFAYSKKVERLAPHEQKVHPTLNPMNLKFREARDSAAHPNSTPISVFFDVTGSMHNVPVILQKQLKELMGILNKKKYVTDPAVMMAALGDATCDRGPVQIGQFESGIEIDDNLTNMWLEGGGGGGMSESYELGFYILARHTATDAWEKRKKKGYAFFIGDEFAYESIYREIVLKIFGKDIQCDLKLTDIVKEAQERYNIFFLIPQGSSGYNDSRIKSFWTKLLGQNCILVEDPKIIASTIAMLIGISEGKTDLVLGARDLKDAGTGDDEVKAVVKSVTPYAKVTLKSDTLAGMSEAGGAKRL